MIIFLYGPDSYRRRKKVKELTNGHLVSQFDFVEESATGEFEKFMSSQSMFESVKFAVLKNFFEYEDAVRFKDVIKNQIDSKSTTLLLNETNEPPGEYEFLKTKPALSQFFGGLRGEKFYDFIAKEATERGVALPSGKLREIAIVCAGNTWDAVNELEKIHLSGGKYAGEIAREDFFWLVSAVSRGKLSALERLFLQKEDGGKIFNILAAYMTKKGERVTEFADYDVAVKSGKLDYEMALLDFCLGGKAGF
ncbi:hypothetical protein A3A20_02615 [Candidatus Wolfebacteria bacterium RIFCSPLOWO2_01_FULL_45_19]|uniref:DNA polymerase III delta N-terminal domain-containing protein n=1 Tax=Candidatus Wolfebacteria bacterium RIFCSPLOWO2_01_FULL_45_19 TaxID=1802557 RepID=A0A1F8DS42_9BACT|nr:MAG: hypothetical protein UX23_C0012G0025 [Parcubacteria group bacterium GW2011_GWB1_45_9]OGM91441.1 MAG: hypothetical protein A3A20_02615 [Candidatus Wolfebacteria bacterium RIFCSPLOWO2_01_FULL_45_19]